MNIISNGIIIIIIIDSFRGRNIVPELGEVQVRRNQCIPMYKSNGKGKTLSDMKTFAILKRQNK